MDWPMSPAAAGLTVACQAVLVLTFAAATAGKVRPAAFRAFRRSLSRGLPVPPVLAAPLSVAVIGAEVVTAVSVAVPATARWGFGLAAVLLSAFTVAVVVMRRRGSTEPCRCFGTSAAPPGRAAVVRNVVLLTTAMFGVAGSSVAARGLPVAAVALAVFAGAVTALLLINLDEIAGLLAA